MPLILNLGRWALFAVIGGQLAKGVGEGVGENLADQAARALPYVAAGAAIYLITKGGK